MEVLRAAGRVHVLLALLGAASSAQAQSTLITPRLLLDSRAGTTSGLITTFSGVAQTTVSAPFVRAGDWYYVRLSSSSQSIWRTRGRPGDAQLVRAGIQTDATAILDSPVHAVVFRQIASPSITGPIFAASDVTTTAVQIHAAGTIPAVRSSWSGNTIPSIRSAAIFAGRDSIGQWQIFATDGSVQGTTQITNGQFSQVLDLVAGSNLAYFLTQNTTGGYSIFVTDGTAQHTMELYTGLVLPMIGADTQTLQIVGDGLVFALPKSGELEFWASDGTLGETRVIGNLVTSLHGVVWPHRDHSGIYYERVQSSRKEVWRLNIDNGATLLLDLPSDTVIRPFAEVGDMTVFGESQHATSPNLWFTDGTAANTFAVPRLLASLTAQQAPLVGVSGHELWFAANSTNAGIEPCHVNLQTGSVEVVDIASGTTSSNPTAFTQLDFGRGTAFSATGAGVSGIYVAAPGSFPTKVHSVPASYEMHSIGNRLIFWQSGPLGLEPHVIDLCPADYDNNGEVGALDMMSYVSDWMAGLRVADTDSTTGQSTAPNATDLFNFLNSWFIGCN